MGFVGGYGRKDFGIVGKVGEGYIEVELGYFGGLSFWGYIGDYEDFRVLGVFREGDFGNGIGVLLFMGLRFLERGDKEGDGERISFFGVRIFIVGIGNWDKVRYFGVLFFYEVGLEGYWV